MSRATARSREKRSRRSAQPVGARAHEVEAAVAIDVLHEEIAALEGHERSGVEAAAAVAPEQLDRVERGSERIARRQDDVGAPVAVELARRDATDGFVRLDAARGAEAAGAGARENNEVLSQLRHDEVEIAVGVQIGERDALDRLQPGDRTRGERAPALGEEDRSDCGTPPRPSLVTATAESPSRSTSAASSRSGPMRPAAMTWGAAKPPAPSPRTSERSVTVRGRPSRLAAVRERTSS